MQQHSPVRWALVQNAGRDTVQKIHAGVIATYRELKRVEHDDPELYQLQVKRVEIEDSVFDAVSRLRRAKAEAEKQPLREQLRARVAQMVDNRQAERNLRLVKLEGQVDRIKTEMASASERRDELIRTRTADFENKGFTGTYLAGRRHPEEHPKVDRRPRPEGDRRGESDPATQPSK